MSSNWKLIGRNSGNMKNYRNVASNKLNYETGKWDSIYDVSGKDVKGYTFDICGQNIVLGVGTDKPFSRLSLGTDVSSGIFDPNEIGQLAAIALEEENNGNKFTGIVLNSNLISTETLAKATPVTNTTGIQIMSSTTDFSLNDITNGQIYLTNNNVTTIGGSTRVGNEYSSAATNSTLPGTTGNRKVVLDVRGSIRTDGYINFFDKTSTGESPDGKSYNNHTDIPKGSLFLSSGGGAITASEGLYYKNKLGTITQVTGGSGGGGGGTTTDISAAFDVSLNSSTPFIVAKSITSAQAANSGGVPVTFSGKIWSHSDGANQGGKGFRNAVTIRDGNLGVITPSGDELVIINAPGGPLNLIEGLDSSGGIILAQKQILIGSLPKDNVNNQRFGYGLIDMQSANKVPSLLSYNFKNPSTDTIFQPAEATNSIILLEKQSSDDGNTTAKIGDTHDCSNSIIIGGTFNTINTPDSIISNPSNQSSSITHIEDISGSNIIFGHSNILKKSCYTLILGSLNDVDNTNISNITGKSQNNVLGSSNKLFNSENSFVQGTSNTVYGNLNTVFGNGNILGNNGSDNTTYRRFVQKSFIQGSTNQIYSTRDKPVQNAFIVGKNNKLDMSFNTFNGTNTSYTLLGTRAGISGEFGDTSNVRFAVGTYEQWQENGSLSNGNGNVFTIDKFGNTRVYGDLIVDGSQVIFRTELFDVSDANINLNSNNGNPNGGGITIIDTTNGNKGFKWNSTAGPGGSTNYWDTSGSDLSTNNLYANIVKVVDISGTDASFNDISAVNFYGNIFTTTGHSRFHDISGTDASFVDISAVNFFSVGSSFFGDIHAKNHSSFNDLSGNDASFNDVSTNNVYIQGAQAATKAYVDSQVSGGGGSSAIASNLAGGILGSIPYQGASNDTDMLAPNTTTTKLFLSQTGTGTAGAIPSWSTLGTSDLPTVPVSKGGTGSTTASAARSALGVDAAGTDNSTDVTLATVTSNYLSITDQTITAGTVPVSLGGTGQTTYTNGQLLIGNTTNNTLTKTTLTAGANITINNGNGSIEISTAAGISEPSPYSSTTSKNNENFTAADGDCYLCTFDGPATYTCTLPTPSAGKKIKIILDNDDHNSGNTTIFKIVTDDTDNEKMAGYAYYSATFGTGGGNLQRVRQMYAANGTNHDTFTVGRRNGGIIEISGLNSTTWFVEADLTTESNNSEMNPSNGNVFSST